MDKQSEPRFSFHRSPLRNKNSIAHEYGDLAEQIIAAARAADLYAHDAPELFSLLTQIELDTRLPEALCPVIAELVFWVSDLDAST